MSEPPGYRLFAHRSVVGDGTARIGFADRGSLSRSGEVEPGQHLDDGRRIGCRPASPVAEHVRDRPPAVEHVAPDRPIDPSGPTSAPTPSVGAATLVADVQTRWSRRELDAQVPFGADHIVAGRASPAGCGRGRSASADRRSGRRGSGGGGSALVSSRPSSSRARVRHQLRMLAAVVRWPIARSAAASRARSSAVVRDRPERARSPARAPSADRRRPSASSTWRRTSSVPPNPSISRRARSTGGTGNSCAVSPSNHPRSPVWIWRTWCSASP